MQMISARPAEREYSSGQCVGVRLGKHWFDSWYLHGKRGCYAIFFSIFSSDQRSVLSSDRRSGLQGSEGSLSTVLRSNRLQFSVSNRCLGRPKIRRLITRATCIFPVRRSTRGVPTPIQLIGQSGVREIQGSFLSPPSPLGVSLLPVWTCSDSSKTLPYTATCTDGSI